MQPTQVPSGNVQEFIRELEELEGTTTKLKLRGIISAGAVGGIVGSLLTVAGLALFPILSGVGAASVGAYIVYVKNRKEALFKKLDGLRTSQHLSDDQYREFHERLTRVLAEGPRS